MTNLTFRQQLAPNSEWIVKEDFTIENHLGAKFEFRRAAPGAATYNEWVKTRTKMTDFKKGEILIIAGKTSTYHPRCISMGAKGLYVPVEVAGRGQGTFLMSDLNGKIDLNKSVQQLIYVMFSPSLGYITKIPYDSVYGDQVEFTEAQKTGGILFGDKLTKAMKKKRPQDAKQFLLSHSGYYDDIDTSDIYYVFEPGGQKVDFPADLVVQTVDKDTKQVVDSFTAESYLKESFRLRPLTLKYGSAIRSVFKEMESKGKDFTTFLMFKDTSDENDRGETSELVKAFKAEIKDMKLPKDSYFMKSDPRSVALAFKDRSQAILVKLGYQGTMISQLVDSQTLDDVKA